MMPLMTTSPETAATSETSRDFTTIGVVGLGTMGAGIAEVFARHGFSVVGVELDDDGVARGRRHLEASTGRAVARGKLSEDEAAELLGRISTTTSLEDLAGADLVIEAVVESVATKQQIFRRLDAIVDPRTILATNTSSLSVTELSTATSHPGRVVGIHFFNPAPVQRLVEVVRTVVTDPTVLADVQALLARLGKSPVVCGDKAGFIANTLLFGYLNHAASMFEGKYASREDIDAAMRFGCGYPMGPLALLDLIGLDTAYEILETMYRQGRDRLHAPTPILKQMVTAGLLGRKTGRGFYTYEAPDSPTVVPDAATPSADEAAAAPARHPQRRRRRHRHHGRRHRRGLRQGRARRGVRGSRGGQGGGRACRHHQELRQADPARPRHRGAEDRGAGPRHRHHQHRRPRRGRPRRRGHRRGPGDQDHPLREPRRDLQAGAPSWPPPRPRCRSSRWPG